MHPHYSPIYDDDKTNILPIVYPSMLALDLPKDKIKEIIDEFVNENKIKDLNSVYFVANDFELHYMRRLSFFNDQISTKGSDELLKDYLKDKKRSMASSLFLGMVRLASAYAEGDNNRIAQALAYYDCVIKELKVTGADIEIDNAKKTFIALMQRRRYFRGLMSAKTESEKIRIIIQNQDSLSQVVDYHSIDQLETVIIETITEWYLMTEDSYVRNVLLGFHAIYTLKDVLTDYEEWLNEFWLQAQVYSILAKKSLLWKRMDLLEWEVLLEEIKKANNLHDIQIFHCVHDLSKTFRMDNLRRIAQTIVT